MNEIALRQREKDLPSMPIDDVKKYVDLIGDAIDALKINRNASSHLNCDKSIIEEMERQIREYSALKVKAQIELGKRTAGMKGASGGDHGNQYTGGKNPSRGSLPNTKADQLAAIDLKPQRASEYERMAEEEETVERYIEKSLADGKAPSKSGALKAIEEKNSCIVEGQSAPAKKIRPTPIQAAAKDRDEKMSAAISRITNKEIVVGYVVDDLVSEIKANAERFESLFTTMLMVHERLISENDASELIADTIDKYIIKKFEELKGRMFCGKVSC